MSAIVPTSDVVKITVNISQDQLLQLKKVAKTRNSSMTEILRHGIALEEFLAKQQDLGNRIIIEPRRRWQFWKRRKELVIKYP